MEMSKNSNKPNNIKRNGKGDSPRNNSSKKFKDNYEKIKWKKKKA